MDILQKFAGGARSVMWKGAYAWGTLRKASGKTLGKGDLALKPSRVGGVPSREGEAPNGFWGGQDAT